MAQRGLRPRISRCPPSGLQILLPGPVTAGTQGWGTWMGTAYCVFVCQTLLEAHCGCLEPGGASTQSWKSSQVPAPALLPGAALAWSTLGFSAEHHWYSAGPRGCLWEEQEIQRALVLLRVSQRLCPRIFGVMTLLLCSAEGEEKQPTLLPSRCCGPVKGAAGHSGLSPEDDSSVTAVAFCMQLFAAEHLVMPALACGASGCS